MNSAIKKIELDLDGKVVSLTPKQAKNLKDALDDLFNKEIVREKEYVPYPITYPIQPYYWEWRYPPIYYYGDRTTCEATTGTYTVDNYTMDTLRLTG